MYNNVYNFTWCVSLTCIKQFQWPLWTFSGWTTLPLREETSMTTSSTSPSWEKISSVPPPTTTMLVASPAHVHACVCVCVCKLIVNFLPPLSSSFLFFLLPSPSLSLSLSLSLSPPLTLFLFLSLSLPLFLSLSISLSLSFSLSLSLPLGHSKQSRKNMSGKIVTSIHINMTFTVYYKFSIQSFPTEWPWFGGWWRLCTLLHIHEGQNLLWAAAGNRRPVPRSHQLPLQWTE